MDKHTWFQKQLTEIKKMSPDGADMHVWGSGYKLKRKKKMIRRSK